MRTLETYVTCTSRCTYTKFEKFQIKLRIATYSTYRSPIMIAASMIVHVALVEEKRSIYTYTYMYIRCLGIAKSE